MNITDTEMAELEAATGSENEWNAACDKIKSVRGGQYPGDWFYRVVLSGLIRKVAT